MTDTDVEMDRLTDPIIFEELQIETQTYIFLVLFMEYNCFTNLIDHQFQASLLKNKQTNLKYFFKLSLPI